MLRLAHARLDDVVAYDEPLTLQVYIDDRSEAGLCLNQCRVYYRTIGDVDWDHRPLTEMTTPDWYSATIPPLDPGQAIEYYISAADQSGRTEKLPRSAPVGTYVVHAEEVGLRISTPTPPDLLPPWDATSFTVTIDSGNEELVANSARLYYRYYGEDFKSVPLVQIAGDEYQATLSHAFCGDVVEFYVSAAGNLTGEQTDPPLAPSSLYTADVGTLTTATLFEEGFESGLPVDWSTTGLWHATSACPLDDPCEGHPVDVLRTG